jgi:hypothetical protein
MTLNELIKRVYYFPDPYMHFNVEFKYGRYKRKVLVFVLSTELTSKEKIISNLESPYTYFSLDKKCALEREVEFICYDENNKRYKNREKDLIKANPGNLALQWMFVNKKMIY